mmetsp:Transcript_39573/g.85364  ORF Transcript_39573/g.85364 Transcript_39573/m.85364 type:complete len:94 (-) Transcript_39573:742-1023(-)
MCHLLDVHSIHQQQRSKPPQQLMIPFSPSRGAYKGAPSTHLLLLTHIITVIRTLHLQILTILNSMIHRRQNMRYRILFVNIQRNESHHGIIIQ